MDQESLHPGLRTVDVARRAGCSVQHVRDLERDGVLPPAVRSASGYRRYGEVHVQSAVAYRALATGAGPVQARRLLRAVHTGPPEHVLELVDTEHARVQTERGALRLARDAAATIAAEPIAAAAPSDALTIAQLADALGVRTSALRHWEAESLLAADRDARGARTYSPAAVRDARVVHQLRLAGYGIPRLRDLVVRLRHPGRIDELDAALAERERVLATRSWALLRAGGPLEALLRPPS